MALHKGAAKGGEEGPSVGAEVLAEVFEALVAQEGDGTGEATPHCPLHYHCARLVGCLTASSSEPEVFRTAHRLMYAALLPLLEDLCGVLESTSTEKKIRISRSEQLPVLWGQIELLGLCCVNMARKYWAPRGGTDQRPPPSTATHTREELVQCEVELWRLVDYIVPTDSALCCLRMLLLLLREDTGGAQCGLGADFERVCHLVLDLLSDKRADCTGDLPGPDQPLLLATCVVGAAAYLTMGEADVDAIVTRCSQHTQLPAPRCLGATASAVLHLQASLNRVPPSAWAHSTRRPLKQD